MALRLRLLGGASIENDDGPLRGRAAHRRRLGLLALLAANPQGGMGRERLIGLLWPESRTDAARHLLSESISVIRRELGEEAILTHGDEVRLNPAAVSCDLARFRDAMAAGDWRGAVEQYAGPFLDGFYIDGSAEFERWAESVREEVGREYGRAIEALAEAEEGAGNAVGAVEWWGRLALHDPYNARVALRLITALAAAGERARAIQFAGTHAARLREELEMEPEPEIVALAERLRAEAPERPPAARPAPGSPPPAVPPPEPAAPAHPLTPDFDILRTIGEGSVASIHLAREPALGRLVALKVLAHDYADDEIARRRFEREAQAAGRIQHPNVAPVFRVGHTPEGLPYIVLPYIDGGSLDDRLAAAGRLSEEEARRYTGQIAAGLAAAHRFGIVHRDVRPANILYDRLADRVLVTDFGLAAVLDTGVQRVLRLTRPGERLGSPRYSSPEQLRGEPVTERADVYGLGMVAFELLTGRLPYDADTPLGLTEAHLRHEPLRASALRPGIDPALDDLIHRCLHKRPERRPFAAEVADALGYV